ncbi:MAG TPA: isoprenylcysteine carboxylmethyltransferase family protein [Bryobacteraceae bacterium]|nr:isoprenylcysteine carboxylmethyltransferase family protein [Bryobacteraceae bacterium]
MTPLLWLALLICWAAWAYPFLFRAPHGQKRESIIARGPTLIGGVLEMIAIAIAFNVRFPEAIPRITLRLIAAVIAGPLSVGLAWTAVTHLGRQFRITAGLYNDHELVTTGPYALVRHPIYTSLLGMLIFTSSLLTPVRWAAVAIAIFVLGTEIRVHAEDKLLASRFGDAFQRYRKSVSAYIPVVR